MHRVKDGVTQSFDRYPAPERNPAADLVENIQCKVREANIDLRRTFNFRRALLWRHGDHKRAGLLSTVSEATAQKECATHLADATIVLNNISRYCVVELLVRLSMLRNRRRDRRNLRNSSTQLGKLDGDGDQQAKCLANKEAVQEDVWRTCVRSPCTEDMSLRQPYPHPHQRRGCGF